MTHAFIIRINIECQNLTKNIVCVYVCKEQSNTVITEEKSRSTRTTCKQHRQLVLTRIRQVFLMRLLCQEFWLRHLSQPDKEMGNSDGSDRRKSLFRKRNEISGIKCNTRTTTYNFRCIPSLGVSDVNVITWRHERNLVCKNPYIYL